MSTVTGAHTSAVACLPSCVAGWLATCGRDRGYARNPPTSSFRCSRLCSRLGFCRVSLPRLPVIRGLTTDERVHACTLQVHACTILSAHARTHAHAHTQTHTHTHTHTHRAHTHSHTHTRRHLHEAEHADMPRHSHAGVSRRADGDRRGSEGRRSVPPVGRWKSCRALRSRARGAQSTKPQPRAGALLEQFNTSSR